MQNTYQLMSRINSLLHPLLESMASVNDLLQEEADQIEKYGRLLHVDQQIQKCLEIFLEIRAILMISHENHLQKLSQPIPSKKPSYCREKTA